MSDHRYCMRKDQSFSILTVIIYSWTGHFLCSMVRGVEDIALVEPSLLLLVKR